MCGFIVGFSANRLVWIEKLTCNIKSPVCFVKGDNIASVYSWISLQFNDTLQKAEASQLETVVLVNLFAIATSTALQQFSV